MSPVEVSTEQSGTPWYQTVYQDTKDYLFGDFQDLKEMSAWKKVGYVAAHIAACTSLAAMSGPLITGVALYAGLDLGFRFATSLARIAERLGGGEPQIEGGSGPIHCYKFFREEYRKLRAKSESTNPVGL